MVEEKKGPLQKLKENITDKEEQLAFISVVVRLIVVACVAEGKVTAGTPFVVVPKPPKVDAEFESTVVILLPLMLYEEPILSAVLAAERDSNFTLDDME